MGQDRAITLRSKVVDISPEVETFLGAGVTEPVAPSYTDLEANIILLEDWRGYKLLFVSIDTLYVGPILTQLLKSAVSHLLPASAVVVAASHTHNSPMLDPTKPMLGEVTQEHFDRIRANLISATRAVFDSPATQVKIQAKQFNVENRVSRRRTLIPIVISWHRLTTLRVHMFPNKRQIRGGVRSEIIEFVSDNGSVVGCVWIMPCHPVAYPKPNKITSNYVGELRSEFRRIHTENMNLPFCFIQGASGDLRPPSLKQRAEAPSSPSFTNLMLSQPIFSKGYSNFSERGYELWVRDLMTDFFSAEQSSSWSPALTGVLRSDIMSLPLAQLFQYSDSQEREITCQLVEISGLRIVLISAEPTAAVARRLRRLAANVSAGGCIGDTFGYLTSPGQEFLGGYEAVGFQGPFSIQRKGKPYQRLPLFLELRLFWKFIKSVTARWDNRKPRSN